MLVGRAPANRAAARPGARGDPACTRRRAERKVPSLIWPLLLFAVVATGTPGANNLLAASTGAQFGVRRSAGLLAGIAVSVVSLVAIAAAGLGAVVASRPALETALRVAGTGYLLWLAVRICRSGRPDTGGGPGAAPGFRAGLLVSWLNPKLWAVALSAAAGYSAISADPLVLAAVLAGVFTVVVVPNLLLWCRGGQFLATALTTDRQWRVLNIVLAVLLAASAAGMWLE
jgi:threonine/homoserine/homoserine lactone efflux protein